MQTYDLKVGEQRLLGVQGPTGSFGAELRSARDKVSSRVSTRTCCPSITGEVEQLAASYFFFFSPCDFN